MYINNPFGPLYKKPHRARGTDMTGKVNVASGIENTQDRSSVWFPKLNRFTQQKGEETKKTQEEEDSEP